VTLHLRRPVALTSTTKSGRTGHDRRPDNPAAIRPYQQDAIARRARKLPQANAHHRKPTGSGKTRIAARSSTARPIAASAWSYLPFISLVNQTVAAFEAEGITHIGFCRPTIRRDLARQFRLRAFRPLRGAGARTLTSLSWTRRIAWTKCCTDGCATSRKRNSSA